MAVFQVDVFTARDYVRVASTSLLKTRIAMAYRTEIEKLEQRHAENPKQWFAALADAYRKQGEVDLAIEYVKGGIEMRPDYASAHIVLGRCYLDKDMDNDAADAFEVIIDPRSRGRGCARDREPQPL